MIFKISLTIMVVIIFLLFVRWLLWIPILNLDERTVILEFY